jgi:hypothetical protein
MAELNASEKINCPEGATRKQRSIDTTPITPS